MGITGTKEPDLDILKEQVIKLKKETDIPIGVGFGIKRPDQAKMISEFSDEHCLNRCSHSHQAFQRFLRAFQKLL